MTEFTPWSMLLDAGLIGILLAIGALLRAVVPPLGALMIPASIIAGFLGLLFGPSVLGWLPFSEHVGTYSSVLIVVVFACLAMSSDFNVSQIKGPIASLASYSILMYSMQVALGMLVVLLLLGPIFGTPDPFGVLIFTGWAGGFGTAAAIGQYFGDAGQPEWQSLAFTSATIGLLAGIVGGIIQAKIGANRGHVKEFAGVSSLPREMTTGLLEDNDERPVIGRHTFSGSSIDSLGFQVSIVVAISAAAYVLSQWLGDVFPGLALPVFSIAFLVGLAARGIFRAMRAYRFVDRESLESISGAATDILIVCGIASIKPSLVGDYALELTILMIFALIMTIALGLFVAPRTLTGAWFEKQIFTWGWSTGAVATGIALLRIVDPRLKSKTLDDFAIAYIPVVPVEVTAVTFAPMLVLAGTAWAVVGIWGAVAVVAAAALFLLARRETALRNSATTES